MKKHYQEKVRMSEIKLALAKVGYEAALRGFAEDLSKASVDVVDLIIGQINELKEAYNELREDVRYYQQQYEKEVEKELLRLEEEDNATD